MSRLTAWALHIATFLLAATGIVYAVMHYLMEPVDPFAVINHPLEPYMLQLHIIVSPILVFLFGIILHSHILFKKENGALAGRRSGLLLAYLFGVMVVSGYLLQVFTSAGHRPLFWLHLGSGSLWALGYASHQWAAFRARKLMPAPRTRAVLVLVMAILALFSAMHLIAAPVEPFEREVSTMGTTLHIELYEPDPEKALQHTEAMIREVQATEQQLSTWQNDSELSRLNRHPVSQSFPLSPSLCELLVRMKEWTRKTEGAFDPGMGSLGKAWKIHEGFQIPTDVEIQSALKSTGIRFLDVNPQSCSAIRQADVVLDPGAFGKGEALDRALKAAEKLGAAPVLMNFGGQVAVRGFEKGIPAWNVSVADPGSRTNESTESFRMMSGSLSTSGGSERDGIVGGRRVSHILDPRTGMPVASFGSVTVWSESGVEADLLSTALFVMGPEKGLQWAEEHRVAACFLVENSSGIQTLKSQTFSNLQK